jgi:beta-glucuronidase
MIETAERMGIMVWEEIPVYQNISFAANGVPQKMESMMKEMVRRDKNRSAVIIWSLSNETSDRAPNRNQALMDLSYACREQDSTRLITSVFSNQTYKRNTLNAWDTLCRYFDILSINEYLGWYEPWQGNPSETQWQFACQKPLIISEFGGEAKYGHTEGPRDEANSWNEYYQERIYKDQIEMFRHTPQLAGVCAWLLVDYRSPVRMQRLYQNGYNRKGLLSEYGEKKKAWYVLQQFYKIASY